MAEPHKILPHGELLQIAPNLWQLRGSLPYPLIRYMTVLRMKNGELLIYSAVALQEDGMQKLEALGRPTVLVVPHSLHLMDARFYKARYPELRVIAPAQAQARLGADCPVDAEPEAGLAQLGLRGHLVPGSRFGEVMLDLDLEGGGRALVLTDLLAHGEAKGIFAKLLGPPGSLGMARIVRWRQIEDKPATKAFLEKWAAEPEIKLVLLAHAKAWQGSPAPLFLAAAGQL